MTAGDQLTSDNPILFARIRRSASRWGGDNMRLITPRVADRQLFVGAKLAEVCNLACGYCYFFEQNDDSYLSAPPFMSSEIIRAAAHFLGNGARDVGIRTISIALHGGEPLMLGKKRFVECCKAFREGIEPYATLNLIVQTNGVLLDREWVELLASVRCRIGVSIDGPQRIHDTARPDKSGKGSYKRVVNAIRLLKECVEDGTIPSFGVLSVIDPNMSGKEAYEHLISELGITRIDFQLPLLHWDTYDAVTVRHVKEFYNEVIEQWLSADNPNIMIRTLHSMFRPFLHEAGVEARINYITDLMEGISIRSNGDVCPDDALPPIAQQFRYTGFNVQRDTLRDFYISPVWNDIRSALLDPPKECRNCEWFGLCGGGAVENRYSFANQFHNKSIYCELYKSLFGTIREYMRGYISDEVIQSRLESASQTLRSSCVPSN